MLGGPPAESEVRQLHLRLENANVGNISPEELRSLVSALPGLLVNTIFGFGEDGWLEMCAERPNRERDSLIHLVGPTGPLFRFLEGLSTESPAPNTWMYEFPFANLPDHTRNFVARSYNSPGAVPSFQVTAPSEPVSEDQGMPWLLSFVAPRLQGVHERGLENAYAAVTPVEYFILCLVAAPVWKGLVPFTSGPGANFKSTKRSSSLPSRRALYNQLLNLYLSHFLPVPTETALSAAFSAGLSVPKEYGELLLRSIVDFWFNPPPRLSGSRNAQTPWTPRIEVSEAVAQVTVHLSPKTPREATPGYLSGPLSGTSYSSEPIDVSRARSIMQPCLANFYDSALSSAPWGPAADTLPFISLLRGWIVTAAPWSVSARNAVAEKTLPKRKQPKRETTHSSAAVGSVVALAASAWGHVPNLGFDPTGAQQSEDALLAGWDSYVEVKGKSILRVLPHMLSRAASLRVGSVPDGVEAIKILARAIGVPSAVTILAKDRERLELTGWRPSAQNHWQSLRDLVQQMDDVTRRRSSTADSLRRAPSNSVLLSPLSQIYGLPELPLGSYMQHVQALRDHAPWISSTGRQETAKAHGSLRKEIGVVGAPEAVRRQLYFGERVCNNRDVPFIGGPWDAPIRSDEFWPAVHLAYWASMRIERKWQRKINLRFLGSYFFLSFLSALLLAWAVGFLIPWSAILSEETT